jgi:hypothetical protein
MVRYREALVAIFVAIGYMAFTQTGSILNALVASAMAGLTGLVVFRSIDNSATRRLTSLGLPAGKYPVRVSARAELQASPELVIEACLVAIRQLPHFSSIKQHDPKGFLIAQTRMSWHSILGEEITIRVSQCNASTELRLDSTPKLSTTTVDAGLNFQNIALVLRSIHRELGVSHVEPKELFGRVISAG